MAFIKYGKRFGLAVQSVALNVSAPLFGIFLSWMVINLQHASLWGEFVKIQVWVMIVVHVFAYGNKEYLLRAFSKYPAQVEKSWSRSFFSRGILLAISCLLFGFLPVDLQLKGWIIAWCTIRFVYQSFDVLVLYRRSFYLTIAAEILGLLLLFVALYKPIPGEALGHLLKIYVIADLLKAVFMMLVFHQDFNFSFFKKINFGYFRGAFMFFLLGITGLVATRVDQLGVNHFMPSASIAQYQVLTAFFIFGQALSDFIMAPFLKNVYRMDQKTLRKVRDRLFLGGVLLIIPFLLIVREVLAGYYHFDLPWSFYALGIAYILPSYYYALNIYLLFRNGREKTVVLMNLAGIVINFVMITLLVPRWGIAGALASAGITRLFNVAFLTATSKKFLAVQ